MKLLEAAWQLDSLQPVATSVFIFVPFDSGGPGSTAGGKRAQGQTDGGDVMTRCHGGDAGGGMAVVAALSIKEQHQELHLQFFPPPPREVLQQFLER